MMRRTLAGLLTLGVVAVGACSDDGGDDAESSGAGGGGDSTEAFCEQFRSYDEQFANDPEAAQDQEQVLEAMRSLDPPEEIADDFQVSLEANEAAAAGEQVDTDAVVAANERIQSFIDEECGFDPEENDQPSPSSPPEAPTDDATGDEPEADAGEGATSTTAGG